MDYSYGGPTAATAVEMTYTTYQSKGVGFLVASGALSLISVLGVLTVMGVCLYRSFKAPEENPFIRTYVAGYFLSLLICDLGQSMGALMNIRWLNQMGVHIGSFCTAQGAIKQASNVGTALWSLVIAIHTFNLLFLRFQAGKVIFLSTLIGVWSLLGMVVLIGPAALENDRAGPFYGISGYWCWITAMYPTERYALEYLFMFFSAGVSLILYSLIFFRLRGNIYLVGWRIHFKKIHRSKAWLENRSDSQIMSVARQMMWYPVGYIILILPIAASRFSDWAGRPVPFEVTIFSATVFMLSGFLNAVLFMTTRRVIPTQSLVPSFLRSKGTTTTPSMSDTMYSATASRNVSIYRPSNTFQSSLGPDLEAQTQGQTLSPYQTRPAGPRPGSSHTSLNSQTPLNPTRKEDELEVIDIGPPITSGNKF